MYNAKSMLKYMIYEVEFPDVKVKDYAANAITENMISQFYYKIYSATYIDEIVDYKREYSAVDKSAKYAFTRMGQYWLRKTTHGWKMLVARKDGSKTWIPLKYMKESNPIDVVYFSKAKSFNDEPGFACWVTYTLRKQDVIISSIKSIVIKKSISMGSKNQFV